MDSSELIYVIATDEDLPLSLQLLSSNGALQPHILPESYPNSHYCALTVYDEQGNDIAEDLTIEEFEYIVDVNGEVFRPTNATTSSLPSFNCFPSTNAVSNTKSDDVTVGSDLEMHSAQIITCSPDGSNTNFHKMQHNCKEHDKPESDSTSSEACRGLEDLQSFSSCMNHVVYDHAFPILAVQLDTEVNRDMDTTSFVCERNTLPVCVNSSTSSSNLQMEQCSVPSSPESLCHDISETKVNLISSLDSKVTNDILACLENAEKSPTINTDVTVTSSTLNVPVLDVATCDKTSNSSVHFSVPCVSVSANSSAAVSLCKDSDHCQSNSDHVCSSYVPAANNSCTSKSSVAVLSEFTGNDSETNSASCLHSNQSNDLFSDIAANCNSDTFECQVATCSCEPSASCNISDVHSISSHSPPAEFSSCGAEEHSAEKTTTAGEADIIPSNPFDTAVTISVLGDDSNANECDAVESIHNSTDILLVEAEGADWTTVETEVPSSHNISNALNYSNVDSSLLPSDCDVSAADVYAQEKNNLAVTPPSDEANASGLSSGNTQNRTYNLRSTVDAVWLSKTCPASKLSSDSGCRLAKDKVQKITVSECRIQSEYTKKYRYNGCHRDLLQDSSRSSSNIQELRQKLVALYRVRRQLRRLQRNKPPSSIAGLSDIDCKRLRLEAMDRELAERQLSLCQGEKLVDLRLRAVEQRERVLSVRERLLAVQHCPFSMQQDTPDSLPSFSQSQSVTQLQSVDPKFDVLIDDCEIAFRRPAQPHGPHFLPEEKVMICFCCMCFVENFCTVSLRL